MKKREAAAARRPNKETRDQLRRNQIVAAAKICVVRYGFHAASMAEIATHAKMSVGQIYRYFANKETIIHAIVERIVAKRLKWIASTGKRVEVATDFLKRVLKEKPDDADDRVLLLEITAEATRNPAVAKIVREADRRLRAKAVVMMRADYPELSEEDAAARVEFLAVIVEGTAFRRITEHHTGTRVLTALYRDVIDHLLPSSEAAVKR